MKILPVSLFLIPVLFLLTGCGKALYVSRLGWHQARISFHSLPVQEVLDDAQTDPEVRRKILFIQEVKAYGEERLGLRKTGSYSRFYAVKGPILYVLTASPKDELRLVSWSFPVAGRVTYKGFFTREEALVEKERLDQDNYDTYLQPSAAYSTLGWLKDPIFSSMLAWDEGALANVILHEMAHATVYFKGRTDLSEQAATFIGNCGAIDFLTGRHGPGSREVLRAIDAQEDDLSFSKWVDQAHERLSLFYGQGISKEEKIEKREKVFQALREEFGELKLGFKTDGHRHFDRVPLNNAVVLAHRQYFHRLEMFQMLYDSLGRDMRRFVARMKEVQASGGDPALLLDRSVEERGLTVSSSPR